MTYKELVEKVKKALAKADFSGAKEHVAIQFNIFGEAEGAFYVEVADGQVNVEPYEYFDRDILISTTQDVALKIATGKLDIADEAMNGRLFAEGKLSKGDVITAAFKAAEAKKPVKKAPAKKAPAKKAPAKKAPAKKAEAKPAEKKVEAKPAVKPAEKKESK